MGVERARRSQAFSAGAEPASSGHCRGADGLRPGIGRKTGIWSREARYLHVSTVHGRRKESWHRLRVQLWEAGTEQDRTDLQRAGRWALDGRGGGRGPASFGTACTATPGRRFLFGLGRCSHAAQQYLKIHCPQSLSPRDGPFATARPASRSPCVPLLELPFESTSPETVAEPMPDAAVRPCGRALALAVVAVVVIAQRHLMLAE